MRDKLRAPMPNEAIKQHPTKTFLSTIKAIYITERLNDVFGIGGWDMEHEIISDLPDYVTVKGRILYDNVEGKFMHQTPFQYGGHKKTGTNTEPADGYKSAVTDCQSKCASYLEIGIDVFKGLHTHNKQPTKTTHKNNPEPEKTGDDQISEPQLKYIKGCGEKVGLTNQETWEFMKWVAEQNKIDPKHWKISKLILPENNFNTEYAKYTQREIEGD